jgi:ankyrin repeat protein
MIACLNGDLNSARKLLSVDTFQLDAMDVDGRTPLFCASEAGHEAIVSLLIQHNAYVNARTNHNSTSLMVASEYGNIECVRLLLAVPRTDIHAMDDDGDTALSSAAGNGHENIVELLLKHGADMNAIGVLGRTAQMGKVCFPSHL